MSYLSAFANRMCRLAAWTFMTDSTLAVFLNSPPHVAISEMTGDLPCKEKLFKAESALEFESVLRIEHPGPLTATLSDLVQPLLSPSASSAISHTAEYITAANLLVLICGMSLPMKGNETSAESLQHCIPSLQPQERVFWDQSLLRPYFSRWTDGKTYGTP